MKTRKYLVACGLMALHSVCIAFNPNVALPGGGDVAPTASVSVSLDGLVANAAYNIICYITTIYPFEVVMLSSNFGLGSGNIISYNLNGENVTQGQLTVGNNIAVISGSFTSPSSASAVFTNLDQDNIFNVNNCYATPIIG